MTMATTKKTPVLPAGLHRDGCPAERIEAFGRSRPDGTQVTVVRCVDCGADLHIDDEKGAHRA